MGRRGIATRHTDREIFRRRLQRPCGKFQVLAVQGGLDVGDRDAACSHGVGIQPDPHGKQLLAGDIHLSHARHRRQALDQIAVGVVRELQTVQPVRCQAQEQDRLGIGVGLGDLRRICLQRQLLRDPTDRVTNVVRRLVQVTIQGEGDVDPRIAVPR